MSKFDFLSGIDGVDHFIQHLASIQDESVLSARLLLLHDELLTEKPGLTGNHGLKKGVCICAKCLPEPTQWRCLTGDPAKSSTKPVLLRTSCLRSHSGVDRLFHEEVALFLNRINSYYWQYADPFVQLGVVVDSISRFLAGKWDVTKGDVLEEARRRFGMTLVDVAPVAAAASDDAAAMQIGDDGIQEHDVGEEGMVQDEEAGQPEAMLRRQPRPNLHYAGYVHGGWGREANMVNSFYGNIDDDASPEDDDEEVLAGDDGCMGNFLDEYLQHGRLSTESVEALQLRQPGNDGGRRETLGTLNVPNTDTDAATAGGTNSGLAWEVLAAVISRSHISDEALDKILGAVAPSVSTGAIAPKNTTDLYKLAAGARAPTVYAYDACSECGALKRCESRDKESCPRCNIPWNSKEKYLSVVDHFAKNYNVPSIAKMMMHQQEWEHRDDVYRDVYDFDFFKDVVEDAEVKDKQPTECRFSNGKHNLTLWVYGDAMLSNKANRGSDSLTAVFVGCFNAPAHVRYNMGLCFPAFITSKTKKLDGLLDVLADEIQLLRFVGVDMYDSCSNEGVKVFGKLATVFSDSRALDTLLKMTEPGAIHGCIKCTEPGFTMPFSPDSGGERGESLPHAGGDGQHQQHQQQEQRGRREVTKTIYLSTPKFLEPTEANAELIESYGKLQYPIIEGWRQSHLPPAKRNKVDIETAQDSLKGNGINVRAMRELAKAHGVRGFPPLRKTGLDITNLNYDFMHAASNVGGMLRQMLMNAEMNKAATGKQYLELEHSWNKRFLGVGVGDMRTLPWVLGDEDINVMQGRNEAAHCGHIHPEMTGGGLEVAFARYRDGSLYGLTCEGHIHLFSPYGKYLLDINVRGKENEGINKTAVGYEDENLGYTYLEAIMDVLSAVNGMRMKQYNKDSAEKAKSMVVLSLAKLQVALPAWYGKHTLHQLIHIAEVLPCWPFSLDKHERRMREVRNHMQNRNPDQRDASIVKKFQRELGTMRELASKGGEVTDLAEAMFNMDPTTPAGVLYDDSGQ